MAEDKGRWLGNNLGGIINTGATIGGWLGIGEKRQDKRQVSQQEKLNAVNAKTSKELADYEQNLKMKMWHDTNYSAQLAEADKAGVSRAAVLGGSGSGVGQGASVNGISGGGASDSSSAMNAGTNRMLATAQLGQMVAQTENIKADTELKKENAGNTEQNSVLQKWQTEIAKLESQIKTTTYQELVEQIVANSARAMDEAQVARNNATISDATYNDTINKIQAEAVGATLQNKLTRSGTEVNEAKIQEIANAIQQKWRELELQGQANNNNVENNKRLMQTIIDSAWIGAGAQVAGDVINVLTKGKTPIGSQELRRTVTDNGEIHTTHTRRSNTYQ